MQPKYYTSTAEVTFTMKKKAASGDNGNDAPSKKLTPPTGTMQLVTGWSDYYELSLLVDAEAEPFCKAITEVSVNGTVYEQAASSFSMTNKQWLIGSSSPYSLRFGISAFTSETANTIVIKATGYNDLTLTVTKDGKLVADNNSSNGGSGDNRDDNNTDTGLTPPTGELSYSSSMIGNSYYQLPLGMDEAFCNAIQTVTVNNQTYSKASMALLMSTNEWCIAESSPYVLRFDATSFHAGDNTLVIKATGYKTLTIHYTK